MTFVALTALSEYWTQGEAQHYLGPWCLFPDHLNLRERERDRVLPSVWGNRESFHQTAQNTQLWTNRLVHFLGETLNITYQWNLSKRYWQLLLWAWTNNFVAETIDRYAAVQQALHLLGHFRTKGLDPMYPLQLGSVRPEIRKQIFELHRFSRILRFLDVPFEEVPPPAHYNWHPETALDQLEERLTHPVQFRKESVLLGFVQYRTEEVLALFRSCKLNPVRAEQIQQSIRLPDAPPSSPLRAQLSSFAPQCEEEELLAALLPIYLPTSLFEAMPAQRQYIARTYPLLPRLIISGLGCQESEGFRVLCAEAVEAGARLVGVQHGAMYGMYSHLPCREFEVSVCDRYLAWGHQCITGENITDVPCPALSHYQSKPIRSRAEDRIVLFANQLFPFLQDFRSSVKAYGSDNYFDWQVRLLAALTPSIRTRLILRIKHAGDLEIYRRLTRYFPEITIESKELSFDDRIGSCALAISDCCSHVYAEVMAVVPTVLLWNPAIWEVTENAERHLSALRDVSVYFANPESAAAHISTIADNPASWWATPAVQGAVNRYLKHYFNPKSDWQEEWNRALETQRINSV